MNWPIDITGVSACHPHLDTHGGNLPLKQVVFGPFYYLPFV